MSDDTTKPVQASPQLENYLTQQADVLSNQVARMTGAVMKKENDLLKKEMDLRGTLGTSTLLTRDQFEKAAKLPFYLAPGNIGDINQVIWPFTFTTTRATVQPASTATSSISITQEAAFIIVAYSKAVFLLTEESLASPFNIQYIDPNIPGDKASGLRFSFRDLQSTREFMNVSIDMEHVGNPRFPTYLPAPMLVLPRANLQVTYTNSSDLIYVPFISFFGVRVRLDDAYKILSTVTQG